MTIDDVKRAYDQGAYEPHHFSSVKLKDNYIIDENKTVKWNQEEVIRHNLAHSEMVVEYNKQKIALRKQLDKDMVLAITNEYEINTESASLIWERAYSEKHSFMVDVWDYVVDLAGFVEKILGTLI